MLKLKGLIITKIDSDVLWGAEFSITSLTKIPIKFLGHGEIIGNLNTFYPERIANQILELGGLKRFYLKKLKKKNDKNSAKKSFAKWFQESLIEKIKCCKCKKIWFLAIFENFYQILEIKLMIIKLKILKKKLKNEGFY